VCTLIVGGSRHSHPPRQNAPSVNAPLSYYARPATYAADGVVRVVRRRIAGATKPARTLPQDFWRASPLQHVHTHQNVFLKCQKGVYVRRQGKHTRALLPRWRHLSASRGGLMLPS